MIEKKDNKTVGERIKERRLQLNMSADDVATQLGKDRATIYRWEGGYIEKMPINTLLPLAKILKTTPEKLMGWENLECQLMPIDKNVVKIPVYGVIPAGIPLEAIEEIIGYEDIPQKLARTGDFFGLQVKGTSMYPKIEDGDTVIIKRQSTFDNGDICAVMVNGFDATLKRIKKDKDKLELIPINPEYEIKIYDAQQCQTLPIKVLGKVIEIRRKL